MASSAGRPRALTIEVGARTAPSTSGVVEVLLEVPQLVAELGGEAVAHELVVGLDALDLVTPQVVVDRDQALDGLGGQVEARHVEVLGAGHLADGGLDGVD